MDFIGYVFRAFSNKRCFEKIPDRIHYEWGFDRMMLKSLKEILRTVKGKKILHSDKLIETTHWLHNLEFLVVRLMMFAIGVHHLYVYTVKTVF
ncbi:hypothetical protein EQO05_01845 [Methanosarcina sp. MSH10X1]|uniref:hypothetical protein n=1 Tax=Methanosarcina sp. MSH10X1 TaxID=2507075 RepID=UPI000FFB2335|nr:hypothetical protein [Methanosarcina sp. MSH10X1]RXA21204.1 hypothetical protein EQO05_01845 [Methanosarcina sp. MSH10X1]